MPRPADDGGVPQPPETPLGPLHLLKMAVGVGSLDELRRVRAERIEHHGGSWVYTRNQPRRADALLAGGSLYWVIRGRIQVRQRVTGLRTERDDEGRAYCLIEVDRLLVPTLWRPWRPFQGWRYLAAADAPPDLAADLAAGMAPGMAPAMAPDGGVAAAEHGPMPEHMLAELRALGLL